MSEFNFDLDSKIPLLDRLEAMEEVCNNDDVPFLAACCRHWIRQVAAEREACAKIADDAVIAAEIGMQTGTSLDRIVFSTEAACARRISAKIRERR